MLAVTAIVAVVAVILGVQANHAPTPQADTRFREATSLRLVSEAQSMLAGTRSGGACPPTNNWLWHDDLRKRLMTAHCSMLC